MQTLKEARRIAFGQIAENILVLKREREHRVTILGEEKIGNNIKYSEAFAIAAHAAII